MFAGQIAFTFFLHSLSFQELSDLAANAAESCQELVVRLPDFMTKELHYGEKLFAKQNGKRECSVQAFSSGGRRARKIVVLRYIGNPGRLQSFPSAPGQAHTRSKRGPVSHRFEFARPGRWPNFQTADHPGLRIWRPDRAQLPSEGLTDSLQHAHHRFTGSGRLSQDPSNREGTAQVTFDPPSLSNDRRQSKRGDGEVSNVRLQKQKVPVPAI